MISLVSGLLIGFVEREIVKLAPDIQNYIYDELELLIKQIANIFPIKSEDDRLIDKNK